MAHFEFVTVWRLKAPLEPVWAHIYDYERWPTWWKGVEQVEVVKRGRPDTVGLVLNHVWKSVLPYKLRFQITVTKVEPLRLIEVAADGELRGVGMMNFSAEGDEVAVRFDWKVDTTRAWMNLIAPAAAPLFRWNHGAIMNWGAECLARRLHATLIGSQEAWPMQPLNRFTDRVHQVVTSMPWLADRSKDWLMVFRESNLLFASWRIAVNHLKPFVPSVLKLDTWDDSAWLTVEALEASMVRFRNLPANPLPRRSAQINVRTYVRFREERGIHFLSLDCPGIVATTLQKVLFRLPFHPATPQVTLNGDNYHAESVRVGGPAHFAASGRLTGSPAVVEPGTLDHFLLNQSVLFTVGKNGDVYRGEMGHRPRVVQSMEGVVEINTLVSALGIRLPTHVVPSLRFCPGDVALAWPIVKVRQPKRPAP